LPTNASTAYNSPDARPLGAHPRPLRKELRGGDHDDAGNCPILCSFSLPLTTDTTFVLVAQAVPPAICKLLWRKHVNHYQRDIVGLRAARAAAGPRG
jgi:hypothetical protein